MIFVDSELAMFLGTNTIVGKGAGAVVNAGLGGLNVMVGATAGAKVTSGSRNIIIGNAAGREITTGNSNVLFGQSAGRDVTGSNNLMFGDFVGAGATTGAKNVLVGSSAGFVIAGGDENTMLGHLSGASNAGSNNVFLGAFSGRDETGSNILLINNQDRGSEAAERSEALIYGVFNATPANQTLALGGGGKVSVGTIDAQAMFHVQGIGNSFTEGVLYTTSDFAIGSAGSAINFRFGADTGNTYAVLQALDVGGNSTAIFAINPLGGNVVIGGVTAWEVLTVVGDVVASDTSPRYTQRDSDDDVAFSSHLDTADTTWGIWQFWKGTDDGTNGFVVGASPDNVPLQYYESDRTYHITTDLVFDVSGSGLFYGNMDQFAGAFNVTLTTVNVWVEVDAATTNIVAGPLNNMTFDGDHFLTVNTTGVYTVVYSLIPAINSVSGGDQHIEFQVFKNDAVTGKGETHVTFKNILRELPVASDTLLNLTAGDEISIGARNTSSSGKIISVDHLEMTMVMVGG